MKKIFHSQCGGHRFEPQRVTMNGAKGFVWVRWTKKRDAWIVSGMRFFKDRATCRTIERGFEENIFCSAVEWVG